jgi:capsular exopolysaccharide synthesis family protein
VSLETSPVLLPHPVSGARPTTHFDVREPTLTTPALDPALAAPDTGEHELRRHLRVLRRRSAWIVLSVVLSIAAAVTVTANLTPSYAAHIRLFVAVQQGSVDVGNAYQGGLLSQQKVASYAELVASPAVTAEVIDRLDLPYTRAELKKRISAEPLPNTVLIDITVTDHSPERARRIADEVALVFATRVQQLEAPAAGGRSLVSVRVPDRAEVASTPVSPTPARNIVVAALLGLCAGVAMAFLRQALETSISSTEQVSAATGASSLGFVHHDREAKRRPLIIDDDPYSLRAESFRQLRTQLQFVDIDAPPRSILITSARAEEGKSTTACNLGISIAQSGIRVCLVEGDLRRPNASRYLGLEGGAGLTSVLVGNASLDEVIQPWQGGLLDVLTAGPTPPNPAELLGSSAMRHLMSELEARYDLVLIDSAPVLPVTDSVVLSTLTSGTILVVRAGRTRQDEVKRAAAQLRGVGGRLYGNVLIGLSRKTTRDQGYANDGYGYAPNKGRARGRRRRFALGRG